MNEIRDIASAPKDETWLILLGSWLDEPCGRVGFWSEESQDWFDSEAASHSLTAFGWHPTHWMLYPIPLPTAR